MALKFQSRQIPQNPGVYFFKNGGGKPLYIGKAANLRARLRSRMLPKETRSVTWEIVSGEAEALIREAELIKKYRPKYNVLMRDDKNYFYVGFSREKYPKIFITHQPRHGAVEANYIGPFTEGGMLRSVLKTLRRAFPYCTCKKPHKRQCLNARIGRCLGFCCLKSSPQQNFERLTLPRNGAGSDTHRNFADARSEYQNNITAIKKILSGKNKSLARELKKEMRRFSAAQKYEEAGKARDQIRALERIFEHKGVIKQDLPTESAKALRSLESILGINDINRIEAYDVANIGGEFAYGSMAVFEDGKPEKNAYRLFKIKTVKSSNDPVMIREVIFRRLKHREWPYPQVILVDGGRAQLGAALGALELADEISRRGRAPESARVGLRKFQTQVPEIKLIALTKNKKHIGDHILIAGKSSPIDLSRLPSPLKNLILHLDSEAHRFAISHYRKLHRKSLLK